MKKEFNATYRGVEFAKFQVDATSKNDEFKLDITTFKGYNVTLIYNYTSNSLSPTPLKMYQNQKFVGGEWKGFNDMIRSNSLKEIIEYSFFHIKKPQRKDGLINEEGIIMDQLALAWNRFLKLGVTHPSEQDDFNKGIHICQQVLMNRVLRRDYPLGYPTYNNKQGEN